MIGSDRMKKSYYAIIPANVRYDENITANAKLLYGEITALCNQEGYCWASNSYFADLYKVKKETVSRWIASLQESGYIKVNLIYKEGSKEIINRYIHLNHEGIDKKINTPIDEKVKGNNTVFNTTSNSSSSAYQFYEQNFGMISPFVAEKIEHWINDLSEELVIESMKIALTANKKFNYAEGILKDWIKNNVRTLSDVEAKQNERKRNTNNKKTKFIEGVDF